MQTHPYNPLACLRSRLRRTLAVMLAVMTLAACGEETQTTTDVAVDTLATDPMMMAGANSVVDLLMSDSRFSTLATAIDSAGLATTLQGPGPFTVFAPTNDAFNALPAGTLETLLNPANRDELRDLLLYHVHEGSMMADSLQNRATLTTLMGEDLPIAANGGQLTVGGANVVEAGVQASNGVVHVVGSVLTPPEMNPGMAQAQ